MNAALPFWKVNSPSGSWLFDSDGSAAFECATSRMTCRAFCVGARARDTAPDFVRIRPPADSSNELNQTESPS